ncbi:hypothetical protein ICP12006E_083 [Vibrio phage ICP1_2006_E]|nr:hypothetical protein [Vibrio phage JSF6]AXQ70708.1 hypothetical protein ICP12006E_083 [Vibrio phage ICP1_2006_E]
MAQWKLIKEKVAYLKVETKLPATWHNGVLVQPPPTITYQSFPCLWEPFDPDEAELLPSGVKTTEAKWLFTEKLLKTWDDATTNSTKADIIYFADPSKATGKKPQAYEVWRAEEWIENDGFLLLDNTQHDYVVIKEGRLK